MTTQLPMLGYLPAQEDTIDESKAQALPSAKDTNAAEVQDTIPQHPPGQLLPQR